MPRKPAAATPAAKPEVNANAVGRDLVALDKLAQQRSLVISRISQELGMELPPFNLELYCQQINFLAAQVADGLLQQGVWLIAMKEVLPHGEFERELTSRTGMSARGAQVIMQATRRFATTAGKKFLAGAQQTAQLTKTRLIELAINFDEAELEKLADGGEVKGHSKEEYLAMSRSELLAAIAERDDSIVRGEAQLSKLDSQLKDKKAKERKEDPDEALVRKFEHTVTEHTGDAHTALVKELKDACTAINKEQWKKADAEQAAALDARVGIAITNGLMKVVNACRLVAIAQGLEPSDIGIVDEDMMPRDFQ